MSLHKSQIFFYALSAFIMGVFISSFDWLNIASLLVLLIFGLIIIAVSYANKLGLLAGFLILFFVLGGWRFNLYNRAVNSSNLIGKEVRMLGYIDNEPVINDNLQRFVLKTGKERVLVTVSNYPKYSFGEFIEVKGRLELPSPVRSKTSFGTSADMPSASRTSNGIDYMSYLKKEGIQATLFFPKVERYEGGPDLQLFDGFKLSLYENIFSLKNKFQQAINLSVAEPNASFINGILLGSRQNIPDDLKDAFRKTGTSHMLAISGYNIMIISSAVLAGLIFFFKRRVAFWISVCVIILFVILTGASASVVRAAIMGLIISFANGYGRLYDQKNSIVLAGAAMIWINPFVLVFDIGFQLSFAAVLGLVYLLPYLDSRFYKILLVCNKFYEKINSKNRGFLISQPGLNSLGEARIQSGGIKDLLLMTIAAQLAVLPLIFYYFGSFSFVSLPANILIIPFLPAAMMAGFLSGLIGMFFLPLGQIIGYLAWAVTSYQLWVVTLFS